MMIRGACLRTAAEMGIGAIILGTGLATRSVAMQRLDGASRSPEILLLGRRSRDFSRTNARRHLGYIGWQREVHV